jgi:CxxC-x17-CxxC domain-containing protein
MGNFKRGDRFEGKKRFGNDRNNRSGDRSERPSMHQAICAECGKRCEVPFRPTGDKPVYCSDCFGKKDVPGNTRFDRRDSGRLSFSEKKMFDAICDKCGKECEVPFRPTGDKPVFCSDCFVRGEKIERSTGNNSASSDRYQKQFDMLNSKLDKIIKMVSLDISMEAESKKEKPAIKEKLALIEKPVIKAAKKAEVKKVVPKKSDVVKKAATVKKPAKKITSKKKK